MASKGEAVFSYRRLGLLAAIAVGVSLLAATSAQAFIYWGNVGGVIGRANNDGSGAIQTFIAKQYAPQGPAVNSTHIYWANTNGGNSIGRANIDGTGVVANFIPAANPYGLAINGTHVFWINQGGGVGDDFIARANLDGTGVDPTFAALPNIGTVYGSMDVTATHIYWSRGFGIGRSNLNGTGVNNNFILPADGALIGSPRANGTHVFYTGIRSNGGSTYGPAGYAARTGLAGGPGPELFDLNSPGGLALYGGQLYFGRSGTNISLPNTIGRSNLDGSGLNLSLVPQANFPSGIAVDNGASAVLGKLKCKAACLLLVHVPAGGNLVVKGKGIKTRKRTVPASADLKLKIAPKGKTRKRLERDGKAGVKIRAAFSATGAPTSLTSGKFVLKD
jgi:hypothetical protein